MRRGRRIPSRDLLAAPHEDREPPPAGGHPPMPRRNLFAIALVAAVSLFCWQATQGAKPKDEMMELYGLFVDAVEQVESNYVRPVNRRELLESALRGMLQNLDPHSQFINESEWKSFKKQIEGRYGGIG